jgi:hypothetical protein
MGQYLLSTYMVEGEVPGGPSSPEEMQAFMQSVIELEEDMDQEGAFVFGGALHGPDAATVVATSGGDALLTDGPFAEAKEHIGGFYILNAADMDEALMWAAKVAAATNHSIEVRPFRATGKVADHMPDA